MSASVDGRRAGSPDRVGCQGDGWDKGPCSVGRQRADGMPGPHGPRLQDAHLRGVRPSSVVLLLAARHRPHLYLSLRAPGPQALAVGRAGEAVAPEVTGAHPLPRSPGPCLSRRSVRHDASRPDRRDPLRGRRLRGHRRRLH